MKSSFSIIVFSTFLMGCALNPPPVCSGNNRHPLNAGKWNYHPGAQKPVIDLTPIDQRIGK
ncbi:MAG TPA: hypothetical protein PKC68_00275 [Alphaproteobacteria bacterium]|nr:hypothetical protein [Alphaproteobacteria bacterium]